MFISISLGANETEVLLGPQDGLEKTRNTVLIIVTAINSIRTIITHRDGNDECLCKWILKRIA